MAIKFITESADDSKPPIYVSVYDWGDTGEEAAIEMTIGDGDGEAVAKFGNEGVLVLLDCQQDDVYRQYPELFDKDGYLKVRKDSSTKLMK